MKNLQNWRNAAAGFAPASLAKQSMRHSPRPRPIAPTLAPGNTPMRNIQPLDPRRTDDSNRHKMQLETHSN